MLKRATIHFVVVCLAILVTVTAFSASTRAKSTLDEVLERGVLRIGMNAAYKPFEYVEGTEIVGYDPDIIAIIGETLGVDVEMIDTNWAGIVASLYSKQFDVIISAMTATPERAQKVLFTQPYGKLDFYFLTKQERDDLKEAVDFSGCVVAIEGGGAAQTGVERWVEDGLITFEDILQFSNPNEAYLAVKVGRADAAVDGIPGLLYYMANNPGFKVVEGFGPEQVMVMATRLEDVELARALDDVLTQIKKDGRLAEIQKKWLGFEMEVSDELPTYLGVGIAGEPLE